MEKIENVTPILPKFTVTLTAGDGGSVSGAGTYTQGTVITITATANTGYKFKQWSDGDTNASRQITVNSNISLSASFEQKVTETWYFNDTINCYENVAFENISFVCFNQNCCSINVYVDSKETNMYYNFVFSGVEYPTWVYDRMGWVDKDFRTIILDEPATGQLLTFLQANATKIS